MPLTRHYETQVEIEILGVTRDVTVEFSYYPGCPARGPSYASGGEPAEGPEVEITAASVFIPLAGDYGRQKKGKWAAGGEWLIDALQDAVNEGGFDISEFQRAYDDDRFAALEARAEAAAEDRRLDRIEAPIQLAAE